MIKSSSENEGNFFCLIRWDNAPSNSVASKLLDLSNNEKY